MGRRIGIVGLGLLGGSLAKALRTYTDHTVYGYARKDEVCAAAMKEGAVVEAFTDLPKLVDTVDVLIYALPPSLVPQSIESVAPHLRPGMLLSDVASTKMEMMTAVYKVLPAGVQYVSTHPMAGSEKGGYEEGRADLFVHHTWIVIDDKQNVCCTPEGLRFFQEMGRAVQGHVITLPLTAHDSLVARISHLPHATAAVVTMLAGNDSLGPLRLSLAAGGFRDHTRVAGGNPALWKEILLSNKDEVVAALRDLQGEAEHLIGALESNDGEALEKYLTRAREIQMAYREMDREGDL